MEVSRRSTERISGPSACSGLIDGGIGGGNDASLEKFEAALKFRS